VKAPQEAYSGRINMVDLESITNILVENAEQLRNKSNIDMSMFPKKQVPKIYAKAAEGTFKKRDFDSAAHYLFLGKQWNKLLEWGTPLYHSKLDQEKKAGRYFLEILIAHYKLPETVAIELAEDILANEGENSYYDVARALYAGKATVKAGEIADKLLNKGIFESNLFLAVAGRELSDKERKRYSKIALENKRYEDAFKFYEEQSLQIPRTRAKAILNGDKSEGLFNRVVEHMAKTKNTFTPRDFKEFGDKFFEKGDYGNALKIYEVAGNTIIPEGYITRGLTILSKSKKIESERKSWSSGQVMPSVQIAFNYLSRYDLDKAKQRIAKYADNLLEEKDFAKIGPNFSQFGLIYKMINLPIPVNKALIAAQIAEEKEKYEEAAKYYIVAGMKDAAKKMGNKALQSSDKWQRTHVAKKAFEALGDKEGLAIADFMKRNIKDY
jgi:hypothetical protein